MNNERKPFQEYTEEQKHDILSRLAANGGNVTRTARETGVRETTIRRWRNAATGVRPAARGEGGDLKRFTKDSWEIIHRANEVVREKVEELGAKDAASIAAGYFDRQAKAEEQMSSGGDQAQEYAAQWDTDKS